jgi:pyruvyl transferase EpsO
MQSLKARLQQLDKIIINKRICYLDIPVYNNIGDLLILKGTLDFFEEHNYQLTNCLSLLNFYEAAIEDDVTIVFQGGGNFGDLYSAHQQHREQIIANFPHHRIVILPQTIHFNSQDEYERSCYQLRKHQDLHVCVRDMVSYNLAKNMSNNVYLMPDMAHQLYPINSMTQLAPKEIYYFKRRDIEFKADVDSLPLANIDQTGDWPNLTGTLNESIIIFIRRIHRVFSMLGLNRFTAKVTSKLWVCYVEYLCNRIFKKIGQFRYIYSSRLHGYILANLMSIDNYLIDNSYSKNKHYYDTWMGDLENKGDING